MLFNHKKGKTKSICTSPLPLQHYMHICTLSFSLCALKKKNLIVIALVIVILCGISTASALAALMLIIPPNQNQKTPSHSPHTPTHNSCLTKTLVALLLGHAPHKLLAMGAEGGLCEVFRDEMVPLRRVDLGLLHRSLPPEGSQHVQRAAQRSCHPSYRCSQGPRR